MFGKTKQVIEIKFALVWIVLLLCLSNGCSVQGLRNDIRSDFNFNPIFFPMIEQPQNVSKKPFLGVQMGSVPDNNISEIIKRDNAVYINDVIPGTAAEEAGIMAGDIITAVDGGPLNGENGEPQDRLRKTIRGENVGEGISLSIIREGKEMTINAKISEQRKIPARVKIHQEIDNLQRSMDETDSAVYRTVQESGSIENFLDTLAQLKEQSLLLDSYKVAPDNPFRLSEINYLLQNPPNIIPVSREITGSILSHIDDKSYDPGSLIKEVSSYLDVEFSLNAVESPAINREESLNGIIRYIIDTITLAESYRKMAFKELTIEEMMFLKEEASPRESSLDDTSPEIQERLLKIAKIVDYQMLFRSTAEALKTVSPEIIQALKKTEIKDIKRHADIPPDVASGDVIDIKETEVGRIIIGGPGKTLYQGDAFLVIDLGGDDLYENSAGASTPEYPISIVIDLAGDDRYIAKDNLSQGTGFMGTGILTDIQGDDLYIAERGSQGVGIFGIGMLIDMKGNDTYKAPLVSQGVSFPLDMGPLLRAFADNLYVAAGK